MVEQRANLTVINGGRSSDLNYLVNMKCGASIRILDELLRREVSLDVIGEDGTKTKTVKTSNPTPSARIKCDNSSCQFFNGPIIGFQTASKEGLKALAQALVEDSCVRNKT